MQRDVFLVCHVLDVALTPIPACFGMLKSKIKSMTEFWSAKTMVGPTHAPKEPIKQLNRETQANQVIHLGWGDVWLSY